MNLIFKNTHKKNISFRGDILEPGQEKTLFLEFKSKNEQLVSSNELIKLEKKS